MTTVLSGEPTAAGAKRPSDVPGRCHAATPPRRRAASPRHAGTPARKSARLIRRKAGQRTKGKMRPDSMAGTGRIAGTGPQVPAYQGET